MHTVELHAQAAQIGPSEYVVVATGDIDERSAPRLETLLDDLVEREAAAVVLDLRALLFLDSRGVDLVTRAVRRARASRARVVLVADSPELTSLFALTALDCALTIRPSLSSAIDELRGRPTA